ncbi:hypothetical protein A0O32_2654 [Anoxybacillus flavithermus]|uniref:Uncharacterized protein n=1 Tax=Anoxybacillus flavithermus TaxID=33934 RepID=A0A178T5V9_9BACL|nr:hypothetical protein A0O32_2654 [Anoxybacillus flavithermus]OAO81558.1 hypothetical protein TAF16_0616 [Anoxybacillus flavithermus]
MTLQASRRQLLSGSKKRTKKYLSKKMFVFNIDFIGVDC